MEDPILHILAVCREKAILEVIERLINAHPGWSAGTALTPEDAEHLFKNQPFSIVLVGAGISPNEEKMLRQRLSEIDPAVTVTRHYGGGSGLLENEIINILQKR